MRDDPMRQADIDRRLANMGKATRCGARTRAGHPAARQRFKGSGQVQDAWRGKRLGRAPRRS
jgi:hypothetical protein